MIRKDLVRNEMPTEEDYFLAYAINKLIEEEKISHFNYATRARIWTEWKVDEFLSLKDVENILIEVLEEEEEERHRKMLLDNWCWSQLKTSYGHIKVRFDEL